MINHLIDLRLDVEMMRSALGNTLRVGSVVEIDAEKGYRIALGEDDDGGTFLSPWLPHPESGKTSLPLEMGQVVGLMSPSGDLRQGILVRGGYSGDHASPNADMTANVLAAAGVRVEIREGKVVISAPGGVVFEGGPLTHNDTNIGDDHVHREVVKGSDLTGPPD